MSVDSTYAIVVMIQQVVYNTEIVFFDLDKKHNKQKNERNINIKKNIK